MTRFPTPPGRARQITTFPADRVCARQGCATILSIYNPNPSCAAHTGEPLVVGHDNAK